MDVYDIINRHVDSESPTVTDEELYYVLLHISNDISDMAVYFNLTDNHLRYADKMGLSIQKLLTMIIGNAIQIMSECQ